MPDSPQYALIGAAGFVASRHLNAVREVGGNLIAAVDPHDSVGVLDRYFPEAKFFTEIERFDRYLEKRRRSDSDAPADYVSICSPNYLHDAHVRLALRLRAHAICEKPLVINPWNLDQLTDLEQEQDRRVFTVLQLRSHPGVKALRESMLAESNRQQRRICLTYVTRRGPWYHTSWKGSEEKSGGLAMNIGIHFFDLLLWIFGSMQRSVVHCSTQSKMSGTLDLEWAQVSWFLSVDERDLPAEARSKGQHAYRSIKMDDEEVDLSEGFSDLHTEVYRDILDGRGFGIQDARPSIDLVYNIRNSREDPHNGSAHPFLQPGGVRS